MNDGSFKTGKSSDIGIDVERVRVTVQSVEQGLIEESFVLDNNIWISFGG